MKRVSVYNILIISNLLVACIVFFGFCGVTQFVNEWTVVLSACFSAVIHFILKDAKSNNNPFLFFMGFLLVFFYQFRIFSLNYTDYSVTLSRSSCTPKELNYVVLFIIIATIVIWRALHFSDVKHNTISDSSLSERHSSKTLKLFLLTLLISLLPVFNITIVTNIAKLLNALFFNPNLFVLFSFAIYLKLYNILSFKQRLLFVAIILSFSLVSTLNGSRSAILNILYILLPGLLIERKIWINTKFLLMGFIVIPVSIFVFTFSTFMRQSNMVTSSLDEKIELAQSLDEVYEKIDAKTILTPLFDRIGFLDYAGESIIQSSGFRSFINPKYCLMSIVDNVITPGFDVFDKPKMSNSVIIFYDYNGDYSRKRFQNIDYQSDQFTMYGEFYVMFWGWFSLIPLYFFCNIFKRIYVKQSRKGNTVLMGAVVYLFVIVFNSFGLDWFVFATVSMLINYVLFAKYIKINAL